MTIPRTLATAATRMAIGRKHALGTIWLLTLLGILCTGALQAQGLDEEDRAILSGDRLAITIQESPDMNATYAVDGDGTILLGDLGRVNIVGLTMEDAQTKLKTFLENKYFKTANVEITLNEFVKGSVTVMGAIGGGGDSTSSSFGYGGGKHSIAFTGDQIITVFEAIVQAGGLHPRANAEEVMILRWKPGSIQRDIRTINVRNMFENLDFTGDEYLRPRDIVYVPKLRGEDSHEVLILGAVNGVGYHPHYDGMNVLRLVAAIGGVGNNPASASARILRPNKETGEYKKIQVDIPMLFAGRAFDQNYELFPGDIFYVPPPNFASAGSVFFLGEVGRPGPYPLPLSGEMGLARAMMQVGFSPFAKQTSVMVRRFIGDEKQEIEFNVKEILKTGEFERDLPLQDGDMIIVKEGIFTTDLELPF
jgi:protein involved in polysaccharide export with SLBB domain